MYLDDNLNVVNKKYSRRKTLVGEKHTIKHFFNKNLNYLAKSSSSADTERI